MDAVGPGLGVWSGPLAFTLLDRPPVSIDLSVDLTFDPIEAVYFRPQGELSAACEPSYAIPLAGTVIAEDLLATTLAVTLTAASSDGGGFSASVAAIDGTAAPVNIEADSWDSVVLTMAAALTHADQDALWELAFLWQASNETDSDEAREGDAESGAAPEGAVEAWGSATLTRDVADY